MNRALIRAYMPSIMLCLIMVMASSYFYSRIPELIPTAFDAAGTATAHSSRTVAVMMMPLLFLFLVLTLPLVVKRSPKFQMSASSPVVARVMTAVGLLLTSIHVGILMNAAEPGRFPAALFISFGLGLFMIALGLTLEKAERNFLIGFRTPWSLASEANWAATHRFGAKVMVITGFLTLVMTTLAVPSLVASISSLIFATVIPVFYSLWYFQNMEKPAHSSPGENAEAKSEESK